MAYDNVFYGGNERHYLGGINGIGKVIEHTGHGDMTTDAQRK